jgi:leucyl-tRNA synthetase
LPVIEVISPDGTLHDSLTEAYTEPGIAVRSGKFDGLPSAEFKRQIIAELEALGKGKLSVNYKLRDWVFSRQRYWGEPIPIYFPVKTAGDPRAGAAFEIDYSQPLPVAESELPLLLPQLEDYQPTGDPQGPLAKALHWRFFQKDGAWYARETNTMPQWAGSCWYYLRFLDPGNTQQIFSQRAYDDWMPVDLYVGGSEHAVLHLLYARFWHKVLFDLGVVRHPEPFSKLVHQGMILGQTFRYLAHVDEAGREVRAFSVDSPKIEVVGKNEWVEKGTETRLQERSCVGEMVWREGKPFHPQHDIELQIVNEKMSKSRGNVVNPDDVVREYGADALRVYEMFMGPLERTKPWQTSGIVGVKNFLDKVYTLCTRNVSNEALGAETAKLMHRTVKKVSEDIDALRFNTAVSQMMICVNHLMGLPEPPREALERLLLCLAPFAPHLAEELWQRLGNAPSLAHQPWPEWDEALCQDEIVEMPVQINGKVRSRVVLPRVATEEEARQAALADEKVQAYLTGKNLVKLVFVPGRILNLIIK